MLSSTLSTLFLSLLTLTATASAHPTNHFSARDVTCTYTYTCDTANGFKSAPSGPGTTSYKRCVRASSKAPDGVQSDCYYPNKGGDTSTGEATTFDASVRGSGGVCSAKMIVSDQAASCV